MRISVGSLYPIFPAGWGGNRFLAPLGPERGSLEGLGDPADDFYNGVSTAPSEVDIQAANEYNSWLDSGGSTAGGGGLTAQQLSAIIAAGGQAAINIAKATSTPSVVPGAPGLVYNPATGQFIPASGIVAGTAQIASSFSQYIPIAILAIGAIFVMKAAK